MIQDIGEVLIDANFVQATNHPDENLPLLAPASHTHLHGWPLLWEGPERHTDPISKTRLRALKKSWLRVTRAIDKLGVHESHSTSKAKQCSPPGAAMKRVSSDKIAIDQEKRRHGPPPTPNHQVPRHTLKYCGSPWRSMGPPL